MKICILGVCGTFMANIACLAKELGHEIIGYDKAAYPPMSDLLADAGVEILPMPATPAIPDGAELVLVGNTVRGDGPWPAFLESCGVPFLSAPEWLGQEVLAHKKVIAIAGTHGKTTTTTMVATILRDAGMDPGYLVGGFCPGFKRPAHIGQSEYFVIESDEYSTVYYDKRPKFMHYNPFIFLLNNVEFDHADLYANLGEIEQAFAAGIEQLPANGVLVYGAESPVADKLAKAAPTKRKVPFGAHGQWSIGHCSDSGQQFEICCGGEKVADIDWQLCGHHNRLNALAAVAIAAQIGISPTDAARSMSAFQGVRRRLEYLGEFGGVHFYDDFAHHPTAIAETLAGIRAKVGNQRVVALLHLASNTMRAGSHGQVKLAESLKHADEVVVLADGEVQWDVDSLQALGYAQVARSAEQAGELLQSQLRSGDHLLFMGNKDLVDLQAQLKQAKVA
jgi:UDP-N-acetylmuramate: L-alanyl-gamma-D-glutamyl-meso-diaminopimelate ligase